jgi:ketosteroid isomerase-like protein
MPLKKTLVGLLLAGLVWLPALAAAGDDVTAPIHQFIDGFNKGDTKSGYAAYASGSVSITDEFAPHVWTGPRAAHAWAEAYAKHAEAAGITDGIVKYRDAARTEIEGDLAYVIIPAVYLYKEHGNPIQEEAQMTFVLHREAQGWKIRSWTWTGVKPHPAK